MQQYERSLQYFNFELAGREREIIVYLPPGYNKSKQLPVLYMHDGQNLFLHERSAYGTAWRLQDTVTQLVQDKKIEGLIVVGINNTINRENEYSPFLDESKNINAPCGQLYMKDIATKLKPFIDNQYSTNPAREHTIVGGSSMGGLVSLLCLEFQEYFSKAIVISPSLWVNSKQILKYAEIAQIKHPMCIYLDIEEKNEIATKQVDNDAIKDMWAEFETKIKPMLAKKVKSDKNYNMIKNFDLSPTNDLNKLDEILKLKGVITNKQILENEDHNEYCWGKRMYGILEWIINQQI